MPLVVSFKRASIVVNLTNIPEYRMVEHRIVPGVLFKARRTVGAPRTRSARLSTMFSLLGFWFRSDTIFC